MHQIPWIIYSCFYSFRSIRFPVHNDTFFSINELFSDGMNSESLNKSFKSGQNPKKCSTTVISTLNEAIV